MISDEVIKIVANFRDSWQTRFKDYPEFQLDFSWPSVGTLDLILYRYRRRENYSLEERETIRGAAAYVACIAHDCWSRFPGNITVTVEKTKHLEYDVVITARGGEFLKDGEEYSVEVVSALRKVLAFQGNFFVYFARKGRLLHTNHNLTSLFGIGLISGMSPVGKGPWFNLNEGDLLPHLDVTEDFLAASSALYYRDLFPAEPLGANPQFYRNGLILPPSHCLEMFPACRGVSALVSNLLTANATGDQMREVAQNFARSPDELLSCAGLALGVALTSATPDISLLAAAHGKGSFAAQLRPAIMLARKALQKPHDLSSSLENGKIDEAIAMAETERRCALVPLLQLSTSHFHNKAYVPLINALVWFEPLRAREILDDLPKGESFPLELTLQGIFLDIMMGNDERAAAEFQKCEQSADAAQATEHEMYLEIKGLYHYMREEWPVASEWFGKALQKATAGSFRQTRIMDQYLLSLLLEGKYREVIENTKSLTAPLETSYESRLPRLRALLELGKEKDLQEEIALFRLATTDRRVFDVLFP